MFNFDFIGTHMTDGYITEQHTSAALISHETEYRVDGHKNLNLTVPAGRRCH